MQWVGALRVAAQARHHQVPHIPPRTLVNRLVDVDVLGFVSAVPRPVGRKTYPLWGAATRGFHFPALVRKADPDLFPQLGVLVFVIDMQVVDVEAAHVAQNLLRALVTPVSF